MPSSGLPYYIGYWAVRIGRNPFVFIRTNLEFFYYLSQVMDELQVIPFDPFPNKVREQTHSSLNIQASIQQQQSSRTQNRQPEPPQVHPRSPTIKKNHNLAKQLIITIKRMMSQRINYVGSDQAMKRIIRDVWKIYCSNKMLLNKQILMVMFNNDPSPHLIQKYKFQHVISTYLQDYGAAMTQLREDIVHTMTTASIWRQLQQRRRIRNKDQVLRYIDKFIRDELQNGPITSRQNALTHRVVQAIDTPNDQIYFYSPIDIQDEVFAE